jgi:hypothetical protein
MESRIESALRGAGAPGSGKVPHYVVVQLTCRFACRQFTAPLSILADLRM